METIEQLEEKLREFTQDGFREQLLPKGLSRGMVWQEGELPPDSPRFSRSLSNDLLNHGYMVLGIALRLRSLKRDSELLDKAFLTVGELIEAVVRRGPRNEHRGFHLTIAAASYHLGHFAARSFSLLSEDQQSLNLASIEKVLVLLMQRRLSELASTCKEWIVSSEHSDATIASRLEDVDDDFDPQDASYLVVCHSFFRAVSLFEFAIRTGEVQFLERATALLSLCVESAEDLRHVNLWWICILGSHLIEDLWDRSLHNRLPDAPDGDSSNWQVLRRKFIDLLASRELSEIDLWPSQLEAARRSIDESDNLVVALPTSSGKTRIAELCILRCLSGGRRVIYVTPLRALSAQVEGTLARTFRPLGYSISSVYGASGLGASDVATMESADIVVATPEKLDFAIRQSPDVIDDVGLIVLDEGHMIGLSEREIRYEVLVQRLLRRNDAKRRRIICLSAIFNDGEAFDAFTAWIRDDKEGTAIRSPWRPTRQNAATLDWRSNGAWLEYRGLAERMFVPRFIEPESPTGRRRNDFPNDRMELLIATIRKFVDEGHSILVYCPERRSVESVAKAYLKALRQGFVNSLLLEEDQHEISSALSIGSEWLGDSHIAVKSLEAGIAVHHGQLPRPLLAEIETLLRNRVLKVTISSPTLAQGVDLSFSVLILNSLFRAGNRIPAKEFANVVGRVGRAYVDIDGLFVFPIFENNLAAKTRKIGHFQSLIREAKERELESGFYLLVNGCLYLLSEKLGVDSNDLAEYVLNQQTTIDELADGDLEDAASLEVVLAELDAGIFALVEDLECAIEEVAEKLDAALMSSYWQRRLAAKNTEVQEWQKATVKGRAQHIWRNTNPSQRKGFYSASIGSKSGKLIIENGVSLYSFMVDASSALAAGNQVGVFTEKICQIAEIVFEIYPFKPSSLQSDWSPDVWMDILRNWLNGHSLSSMDGDKIGFIQEGIVYRLVWAVEAVRLILESVVENDGPIFDDTTLQIAVCLTYGVPNATAAKLLEAGLESRTLAVRLVNDLELNFDNHQDVQIWVSSLEGISPIQLTEKEETIWRRFVKINSKSYQHWDNLQEVVKARFEDEENIEDWSWVRVESGLDEQSWILSPDFEFLGTSAPPEQSILPAVGAVLPDKSVQLSSFGPVKLPAWLKTLLESGDLD